MTNQAISVYADIRNTTPEAKKGDFRVYVEVEGQKLIVGYKSTQRAAKMQFNRIGHDSEGLSGWGWETKDKYNESQW